MRAVIIGLLRTRGLAWCLSILWAGLGAAGSGYIFVLSTHLPAIPTYSKIPCWVGEPSVVIAAAELAAATWLLLTIPVLVTGLVRLRGGRPRAAAWIGAWVAGCALMVTVANWQTTAPAINACDAQGCSISGYSHAVVSWGQLAICAAWLALGVAMMLIVRRPSHGLEVSHASHRYSST